MDQQSVDQPKPNPEVTILDLQDPAQARDFCRDFVVFTSHGGRPMRPQYVDIHDPKAVGNQRRIEFDTMSDEDAVVAAQMLFDLQMDQLQAAKARGEVQ